MTFKDSSVIVDNEDYEGDILENVDLQSNFRQRMKLKKQTEAKTGVVSLNGLSSKSILPQYDEEDEEITQKRQSRILLASADNDNVSGLTKKQRMEELREKLSGKSKQKVSLDVSKVSAATQYQTIYIFLSQNIGSDYATTYNNIPDQLTTVSDGDHPGDNVGGSHMTSGFKKIQKKGGSLLKKRQAEEDIVTLLERDERQLDQQESGLGTRDQKQR